MFRTMLKSAVQRATVTAADPPPGALLLDEDVLDAADVLAGEQVAVVDVATGARSAAHAVAADRGSGVLAVAGASAGDRVTVLSHALVDGAEARHARVRTVFVDDRNRVVERDPLLAAAPDEAQPADEVTAETDDAARLDALISADTADPVDPAGA